MNYETNSIETSFCHKYDCDEIIGKHYSNWLRLLGVIYLFINAFFFFTFLLELYSRVKLILCGLTLRGQWTNLIYILFI